MKKFVIAIEEMIVGTFEVEADSSKEAIETAREKYRIGKFVLEPGDLVSKQMAVIESNEEPEWFEF
ncbi:MAG: DpnD/PcfM family protein [Methanimicrococcus sp.]|nr:DpnD/PcfM family protein [Methanimicrococcus sp.]